MKRRWLLLLLAMMLFSLSAACGEEITSAAQLNAKDKTIAVWQGSSAEGIVRKELPLATIAYYNDSISAFMAVAQGKADAFVFDRNQSRIAIANGVHGVHLIDDTVGETVRIAVGISPVSKIPDLQASLNRFIDEIRNDGTLDDMFQRWVIDRNATIPEISVPENAALHLTVGTTGTVLPYSYYIGQTLNGYDIELARRFASWLGASLEFKVYDFGSIVSAAVTGNIDCIMSNLNITPERAEVLPFSQVLFEEALGITVRDATTSPASAVDKEASTAAGTASGGEEKAETANEAEEENIAAENEVSWRDYNGKRLGVLVGPLMEDAAHQYFPDSEYLILNSYPDCIAALLAGKIDAYLGDEPSMKTLHHEQPEIDYIHDRITENNYSFAFRKDDPHSAALCAELNEFLARCWKDGTMQELDEIWFGTDEDRKIVDMSDLTGEKGTLRVVTTSTDMPFSYIKDGKNVGYDIDLVVRFCRERGYQLELGDVDFAGRIPAIQSGKYDFSTDMNVTPEREEQVLFSDPTSKGGIVLAVLASDLIRTSSTGTGNQRGFWSDLSASFERTFLRENRWKLFAEGTLNTLIITLLAILFGTALGFGLFMLCRNGNPAANLVTRFCLWLVQGMPMVVLLMILYYIVFSSSGINGIAVAVIGFTLTFGAAVFGMLKMGVGTVDAGQYEAAYALGHSNRHTFFRIILPQAIPHVLPAYQGEIVGLIKATAIVGYIAVQDLTKMGDIVRSRTYEAFFPLIAITVIYFVLEGLFSFLVGKIRIHANPKKRNREKVLKGVKIHDQD